MGGGCQPPCYTQLELCQNMQIPHEKRNACYAVSKYSKPSL